MVKPPKIHAKIACFAALLVTIGQASKDRFNTAYPRGHRFGVLVNPLNGYTIVS